MDPRGNDRKGIESVQPHSRRQHEVQYPPNHLIFVERSPSGVRTPALQLDPGYSRWSLMVCVARLPQIVPQRQRTLANGGGLRNNTNAGIFSSGVWWRTEATASRGVQLSPISTISKARSHGANQLLALFYGYR